MLLTLVTIFSFNTFVLPSDVGSKSEIRDLTPTKKKPDWRSKKKESKNIIPIKYKPVIQKGNLPTFLVRRSSKSNGQEANPIRYPELKELNRSGMKIGDVFDCIISLDIIGYVGAVSPVSAEVLSGPHKGSIFLGNATLDPQTKNILIQFSHIRDDKLNKIHELKATVLSVTGQLGLKGTHRSHYWQYFFATLLARGAQGYASALVDQRRNIFGDYQRVPTPETAGKVALAESASKTADILQDKMRTLPEYTTVKGPIKTKVFIMETPKLTNF